MGEILEFFSVYWVRIIIAVLGAYLMSSVNTSIIVTKIVLHKDIRTLGSGNAGFTNVLRCVGKVPAIITFVGDFLKGVISVAIAYFIMWGEPELQKYYLMCTAGLFAVVGHTMPIYYKFKGGKGVVTTAAVMIMTDWRVLIVALLIGKASVFQFIKYSFLFFSVFNSYQHFHVPPSIMSMTYPAERNVQLLGHQKRTGLTGSSFLFL